MPLFNNYGDVRTSTSTATDPSFVKGYATANDGGEGLFVYDATSVAPDNDGTVLSHTSGTGRWLRLYDGYVNVQWFGVRPGSASYATNNTLRLTNAINNGGTQFLIPKGVFYINNLLGFGSKNNRSIFADSATIINTNKLSGTMSFENCEDITIEGGIWTREGDYTQNDAYGSTHTFIFGNCAGIRVDRVHIDKSPQAGISMINVFDAVISDCRIQNCWRDGIYAHFAANVTYIGNHLQDIKDDAMSIHEYGITTAGVRSRMEAAGFTVGGHSVVANNTVSNAYTGFASIGCENIVVSNNQIEKTVTAGVAIFNDSYDWPLARVKKISISNNLFDENCGTQMIMGVSYSLSDCDLISRARATIFVGTLLYRGTLCGTHIIPDPNSPGSAARLSNVIIVGNQVTNGHQNGAYVSQVDGLVFSDNTFTNCITDGRNSSEDYNTGIIVELYNSRDASIYNNKIIDDRATVKHFVGYGIINVTGNMGGWTVRGVTSAVRYMNTAISFPYDSTQRFQEHAITIDPPNLAINAYSVTYYTIPGPLVSVGDFVTVAPPYDTEGVLFQGYIANPNQIALLLKNVRTDMAINLVSGVWKFRVFSSIA